MAKTLHIIDDQTFRDLPSDVSKIVLAEVKSLYSFVPLTIALTQATKLPHFIDFTDAIVKLVAGDDDVSAEFNDAQTIMFKNMQQSIKDQNVPLQLTPASRTAAQPDRGGIGTLWKTVTRDGNGNSVAISLSIGISSIESAKQAWLELATGSETLQDEIDRQNQLQSRGGLPNVRYFASHQALRDTRIMLQMPKPLSDWPDDDRKLVGSAIARLIAHEARHQFVGPQHSGGGLGTDSPKLLDPKFAQFDSADQKNVSAQLTKLANDQKTASIKLEAILPGKAPFM